MDSATTCVSAPVLERYVTERVQDKPGGRSVLVYCSTVNDINATSVEYLR